MVKKSLIPGFAHAVKHQLRLEILKELNAGPASASQLAKKLGRVTPSDVKYHLGVLEDPCELVEPVDPSSPGPAVYKLRRIAVDDLAREMVPIFWGLQFEPFRTFAQALFEANMGSSVVSDDAMIVAAEISVDERGANEIHRMLLDAIERFRSVAMDDERCPSEGDPGPSTATVGAVLFRSK